MYWISLVAALAAPLSALAAETGQTYGAKRADLSRACRMFSAYDHNGDGIDELEELRLTSLGGPVETEEHPRQTILVIVESRLLATDEAGGLVDLTPSLRTYAADLTDEGYDPFVLAAGVYAGPVHQDGLTVLAWRAFLRRVRDDIPDLAGVVLIGDFPEASLVRRYCWKRSGALTLNEGKPNERKFEDDVQYLRDVAELVAYRSEIVLADLDGQWDAVYRLDEEQLPNFVAAFPDGIEASGGATDAYEFGTNAFADFFYIDDGKFALEALDGGRLRFTYLPDEDDECAPDDLALPNPIARPDISVSRINARHVGLEPKSELPGGDGPLLGEDGLPREVSFGGDTKPPKGVSVWEHSEATERRLLVEYFDRNHRYRAGEFESARRPSCISTEFGSSIPHAQKTFREWRDLGEPGCDIEGDQATLAACIRWLKEPALLRFLKAHSDPWGSTFAKSEEDDVLEELGGQAWAWKRGDGKLVPGIENCGKLDFAIERSLWQNGVLPDCGVIYLHIGCESTAPEGGGTRPYSDPQYGYWQGAESLLFYCNGLTLIGRSKVFYDSPRGFCEALADGGTCGDAWAEYYNIESLAEDVEEVGGGIGRKRAYFWSLLGDWTIRI